MNSSIVPVVEGYGEVRAVPELLRRVLHEKMLVFNIEVDEPWRVGRKTVVRLGGLEKVIAAVMQKRRNAEAIIVLLDADDDCPALLGPELLKRAKSFAEKPVAVILAKREFEPWFLGAVESLGMQPAALGQDFSPERAECVRGAKEQVRKLLPTGRYTPADDQVRLTAKMDLDLCRRRCPSFDKLIRDVEYLVMRLKEGHPSSQVE